jgi:hypothetical protein
MDGSYGDGIAQTDKYDIRNTQKDSSKTGNVSVEFQAEENLPCALTCKRFITALKFLSIIQQVIVNRGVKINNQDQDKLYLGYLQTLRLASLMDRLRKNKCRAPTLKEWAVVENNIVALERYLTDDLLRHVEIRHILAKILEKYALSLLIISVISLLGFFLIFPINWKVLISLSCFTFWSAATGALGSTAFLYVNALSIQVDPKVDLTSRTLITMRLILGSLFAVILAVPFGYESFYHFCKNLSNAGEPLQHPTGPILNAGTTLEDSLLLLLPFTLGFSTPLALTILHRLIKSVQSFFGINDQLQHRRSGGSPDRRGTRPGGPRK